MKSIERFMPGVVITDIFLPDGDGLEVIKKIRSAHPEIKILAISGGSQFTPEPYLAAARYAGAQRTLARPFQPSDLLQAMNEIVAG